MDALEEEVLVTEAAEPLEQAAGTLGDAAACWAPFGAFGKGAAAAAGRLAAAVTVAGERLAV